MTDQQPVAAGAAPAAAPAKKVAIPKQITVRDLSDLMGVTPIDMIKDLMKTGVMAAINESVDFETASKVATEHGFEVETLQEESCATYQLH